MSARSRLLHLALPLVETYGFTRHALARSVLYLPPSEAHTEPLSETSVSALFGSGDLAKRNLINAWLYDGICQLRTTPVGTPMKDVLHMRLKLNEPVLQHLPEAFAILASPTHGLPLDPRPAFKHTATIADEACHIAGDKSLQLAWYTQRGSLAVMYGAAELHQLTSPGTAYDFLDSLLDRSSSLKSSLDEVTLFSLYIMKSVKGIVQSSGIA